MCEIIRYKRACFRKDRENSRDKFTSPSIVREMHENEFEQNVVTEHLLNLKLCSRTIPFHERDHFS